MITLGLYGLGQVSPRAQLASAADVPADLPAMDILRTPHYEIHTDLPDELSEDLSRRMEAMYAEYTRRLAIFNPETKGNPPLKVYLFSNRADYETFTGGRMPNSAGCFMPDRQALAAFLNGQGRDGLRKTLQHEAFHQFADSAISRNMPIWLNEGLAQVFEEGLWTGNSFALGQVPPRRVRQLKADMESGRLIPFDTILWLSPAQWRDNMEGTRGAAQYNQAWAMVHMLIYETDESGNLKYRARFIDMLRKIHSGQTAENAFTSAFSKNIQGFQDRFLEFADQLQPTDTARVIENHNTLADMLVAFEKQGRTFKTVDSLRTSLTREGYRMNYSTDSIQWSSDSNTDVYFRGNDGRTVVAFQKDPGSPLPDLLWLGDPLMQLRIRFYAGQTGTEHELLIEARAE